MTGESLFNDGIGVVVFHGRPAASSPLAATPTSPAGRARLFLLQVVGGVAARSGGRLVVAYRMLRDVDNYQVEVLITLALATGVLRRWPRRCGMSGPHRHRRGRTVASAITGSRWRCPSAPASTSTRSGS